MTKIAKTSTMLDIRSRIITIRGVQVMLDRDLAMLYGIETKVLNQAVKRNIERFPGDFIFHLSKIENIELVTNCDRFKTLKHSSVPMTAFTEHGILMLSSVLKSKIAIEVNVRIMREFVAMRRALASLSPVLVRLDAVERRQLLDQTHNEERFKLILDAMQAKTFPPQKVFFNGDVFDAEAFATKYILSAKYPRNGGRAEGAVAPRVNNIFRSDLNILFAFSIFNSQFSISPCVAPAGRTPVATCFASSALPRGISAASVFNPPSASLKGARNLQNSGDGETKVF